jgi:muramidase (phage lysozyme)
MTLIKDKIKTASHRELLANPKVQAMLKTIRYAEGTSGENGYTTRVGGGQFSDLSSKPGKKVFIKSINNYSSAEGAYQFLNSSWVGVSKKLGLKDFSPESQDIAAIDLIIQRGAMDNILKDDFQGAINKLSPEWASLPKADGKGTYANQKAKKIEQLSKIFYNGKVMTYPKQLAQQTQQVTTDNTNFETPQISTNLASVPDAPEKEEVVQAKQELQQKQNEENFINDLYDQRQEEEQVVQPQLRAQTPQANVLERYAQIENFVDESITAQMQQGGGISQFKKKPFQLQSEVSQVQRDGTNIPKQQVRPLQQLNTQQKEMLSKYNENFKQKPKEIYLNEGSKEYKNYKEKETYYNPKKIENISSDDWKLDFIYDNDWLIDTPIIGEIIKNQAKNIASKSGGNPTIEMSKLDRNEVYRGDATQQTEREPLLNQYFSKEALLPKSKYKPTSDYLEFLPSYSIKGDFDKKYKKPEIKKWFNEVINSEIFEENNYDEFVKNKKPIYLPQTETGSLAEMLSADLGGHKMGVAWDEDKNLPYVSISDAWDFEPTHYSEKWKNETLGDKEEDIKNNKKTAYQQSFLMHKAGNPFKVYDRFYFDPKTKEYISDYEIDKRSKTKQQGGIIKDNRGQWEFPGEVTQISSPNITMKNVPYNVLGISDTGEQKMMQPNGEYYFKNAKTVTEYPQITEKEKAFLKLMQQYKK